MPQHGAQEYFAERARFERRVTAITVATSLAALAVLLAATWHPAIRRAFENPQRFGFEGQDQYVRRIVLETGSESHDALSPTALAIEAEALKGGRPERDQDSDHPAAAPETRRIGAGPGSAEEDYLAQARARFPQSLVVQSEDLVIERLVRPLYPSEAQDRDLEGSVALIAQLDTLGVVQEIEIVGGTGEPLFENAARYAVSQCLFRPYRVDGQAREVAVLFRFAFQLK